MEGSESPPSADNQSMLNSQLRGSALCSHGPVTKHQARNGTRGVLFSSRIRSTLGAWSSGGLSKPGREVEGQGVPPTCSWQPKSPLFRTPETQGPEGCEPGRQNHPWSHGGLASTELTSAQNPPQGLRLPLPTKSSRAHEESVPARHPERRE